MMSLGDKVTKIKGTAEAWDSRELGADRKFVKVATPEMTGDVDAALGLQSISIRLDKNLRKSKKNYAN